MTNKTSSVLLLAILAAATARAGEYVPITPEKPATEGEKVYCHARGLPCVPVAVTFDDCWELIDRIRAGDIEVGVPRLIDSGRIFIVIDGSTVRVLQRIGAGVCRVKLLTVTGDHANQEVFVPEQWLARWKND